MQAGHIWSKRNAVILTIMVAFVGVTVLYIRLGSVHRSDNGTLSLTVPVRPPRVIQIPVGSNFPALGQDSRTGKAALPVKTTVELGRPTPAILDPTNLRYVNHRALTETQQAIRTFLGAVVSNGVPTNCIDCFEQWANELYRAAITQCA